MKKYLCFCIFDITTFLEKICRKRNRYTILEIYFSFFAFLYSNVSKMQNKKHFFILDDSYNYRCSVKFSEKDPTPQRRHTVVPTAGSKQRKLLLDQFSPTLPTCLTTSSVSLDSFLPASLIKNNNLIAYMKF